MEEECPKYGCHLVTDNPPKDDHSDTVKRENLYSGSWDNTHVFTDMGVVLSVQNIGFLKANHILASWSAVARGSIQVGSLTELRQAVNWRGSTQSV